MLRRATLQSTERPGSVSGRALVLAPGVRLRRLAQHCASSETYTSVFAPILDRLLGDYIAALADGGPALAKSALLRGYLAFWLAAGRRLPLWLFKGLLGLL